MNRKRRQKLHEIYATIPKINCKRLCTGYCGCIGMEVGEAEEMTKAANGQEPEVDKLLRCGYLDSNGNCKVYDDRPFICRVWGVVENLRCEFGCEVERVMTVQEMFMTAIKIKKVAGQFDSDGDAVTVINCTQAEWQHDIETRDEEKRRKFENLANRVIEEVN